MWSDHSSSIGSSHLYSSYVGRLQHWELTCAQQLCGVGRSFGSPACVQLLCGVGLQFFCNAMLVGSSCSIGSPQQLCRVGETYVSSSDDSIHGNCETNATTCVTLSVNDTSDNGRCKQVPSWLNFVCSLVSNKSDDSIHGMRPPPQSPDTFVITHIYHMNPHTI